MPVILFWLYAEAQEEFTNWEQWAIGGLCLIIASCVGCILSFMNYRSIKQTEFLLDHDRRITRIETMLELQATRPKNR